MCECGCSLTGEFWRLPCPKGTIYIVQKYPGCKDCSTPCGISIRKIEKKTDSVGYSFNNEVKELVFGGSKLDQSAEIGFFSQEDLQVKLKKYLINYFNDLRKDKIYDINIEPLDEHDADTASEEFAEEFFNG